MYSDNINNQIKILIIYKYNSEIGITISHFKALLRETYSDTFYTGFICIILNIIYDKTEDRQNRERESHQSHGRLWIKQNSNSPSLHTRRPTPTHSSPLNLHHLLCSISEESYSSNK
ncbi:unnamed protein product [Brassica rapa]|uniref:Uncharacterized protein n=1 Tax=Brassica campestris TaxID=3711 RepID=A0A3P5YXB2_BRACM|nr:unnamed protein product [Brassica rapa]VDC68284.1 unnamed protein product [Brassica rapa]